MKQSVCCSRPVPFPKHWHSLRKWRQPLKLTMKMIGPFFQFLFCCCRCLFVCFSAFVFLCLLLSRRCSFPFTVVLIGKMFFFGNGMCLLLSFGIWGFWDEWSCSLLLVDRVVGGLPLCILLGDGGRILRPVFCTYVRRLTNSHTEFFLCTTYQGMLIGWWIGPFFSRVGKWNLLCHRPNVCVINLRSGKTDFHVTFRRDFFSS